MKRVIVIPFIILALMCLSAPQSFAGGCAGKAGECYAPKESNSGFIGVENWEWSEGWFYDLYALDDLTVTDDITVSGKITATELSLFTGGLAPGSATDSTLKTDTVEITNAQIKAIAATPKELVAAPGADKLVEVLSAVLILDYGSEVLAEPSAPDDLALEYDNGTGTQIATWDTTGFITASADAMEIVAAGSVGGAGSAIGAATNVNKNVVLINTGGEYTGNASNDTTITVKITYRVHTLGL